MIGGRSSKSRNELSKSATVLNSMMKKVKDKVDEGRKARTQDSATRARARNKAILKWKLKGDENFPFEFLRYLYDSGLFISEEKLISDAPAMIPELDEAGHDMDAWTPTILRHDRIGAGSDLEKLGNSIGRAWLDSAMKSGFGTLTTAQKDLVELHLPPQGGGKDTVEQLNWVPGQWRQRKNTPESLRTIGAPWLLSSTHFGIRARPEHFPMSGFGAFLEVLHGSVSVALVPNNDLLDRGMELRRGVRLLLGLVGKHFASAMKVMQFAVLEPKHTLWIPYGFQPIVVSRTEDEICHLLYVPFVNSELMNQMGNSDEQKHLAITSAEMKCRLYANTGFEKHYRELADEVKAWVTATDSENAPTRHSEQPAIENGTVG